MFSGDEAASFIISRLQGLDIPFEHIMQRAFRVLAAFRKNMYLFAERRARISRCIGINRAFADAFLIAVDLFVDPSSFLGQQVMTVDYELIGWYKDGTGSDVDQSSAAIVTCPYNKCFSCGGLFVALSPFAMELQHTELQKSSPNQAYLYGHKGKVTVAEQTRICSVCKAEHFTSHFCVNNDGKIKIFPYPTKDVAVFRSTSLTYIDAVVLNSAVLIYDEGRVPFDTLVNLLSERCRLGERAPPFISPKLIQQATEQWLVIWWLENVPSWGAPQLDITEMYSLETTETFLARETRDNTRVDRGWFSRALTVWAIKHRCVDHPACGLAWVQDGQFDLTRPLQEKSNIPVKEIIAPLNQPPPDIGTVSVDSESPEVDSSRQKRRRSDLSFMDRLLGLDVQYPVKFSNGEFIRPKGEPLDSLRQSFHPFIRKRVRCSQAHLGHFGEFVGLNGSNLGTDIASAQIATYLSLPPSAAATGIITHRDSCNTWSVYFYNYATREDARTGMLIQLTSSELESITDIDVDDRFSFADLPTYLWGKIERFKIETQMCPLVVVNESLVDSDAVGDARCLEESIAEEMDSESSDNDIENSEDSDEACSTAPCEPLLTKVVLVSYDYGIDCVSKADAQPVYRYRRERTNHIEVIASVCRINYCVREFVHSGEGAITNCQQLIDLMDDYVEQGVLVPLVRFVDDECSNVVHLFTELVSIARGKMIRHSSISGVIGLLCMDGCIDAFHFVKDHKELFCKKFLNPFARNFPPGFNSEAVEQNWQELVKHCPSLTFMSEGNFRFMLLSIVMMENIARSKTPVAQQNTKRSKAALDNLGMSKHARNRKLAHGSKKKVHKEPKTVHGRLPIPDDFVAEMPFGYDGRLRKTARNGKRVYTHFDGSLFRVHEEELIALIRTHIPEIGFGRPPVACLFRARMALHKWLVDKVIERSITNC